MSLTETSTGRDRSFSEVLDALGHSGHDRLTIDEVVEAFGERGIGALILVLALLALVPWPPGAKAIFSAPIILLASELALQRDEVWLPRWLLRASVSRAAYRKASIRLIRPIRFVENLTRPRMRVLTGPLSKLAIGLTCVLLAIMMALPIPFGDMLPGVTLVLFSLGVMQRDGIAVLLGWVGTAVCAGYLALIWTTLVRIIEATMTWAQGLF